MDAIKSMEIYLVNLLIRRSLVQVQQGEPEKRTSLSWSPFFNEIRLSASEIASLWNTLTRMKYLLRKCWKANFISHFASAKYFIIRKDYFIWRKPYFIKRLPLHRFYAILHLRRWWYEKENNYRSIFAVDFNYCNGFYYWCHKFV